MERDRRNPRNLRRWSTRPTAGGYADHRAYSLYGDYGAYGSYSAFGPGVDSATLSLRSLRSTGSPPLTRTTRSMHAARAVRDTRAQEHGVRTRRAHRVRLYAFQPKDLVRLAEVALHQFTQNLLAREPFARGSLGGDPLGQNASARGSLAGDAFTREARTGEAM